MIPPARPDRCNFHYDHFRKAHNPPTESFKLIFISSEFVGNLLPVSPNSSDDSSKAFLFWDHILTLGMNARGIGLPPNAVFQIRRSIFFGRDASSPALTLFLPFGILLLQATSLVLRSCFSRSLRMSVQYPWREASIDDPRCSWSLHQTTLQCNNHESTNTAVCYGVSYTRSPLYWFNLAFVVNILPVPRTSSLTY
jgi:hypothetical protein